MQDYQTKTDRQTDRKKVKQTNKSKKERRTERQKGRDRTNKKQNDSKYVTWSFTPSQPLRLYQGETERQKQTFMERNKERIKSCCF